MSKPMTSPTQNTKNVSCLGFLDHNKARRNISQQYDRALLDASYGRHDQLHNVCKFVEAFRPGDNVRVALRRRTFTGVVLGFRMHPRRGWTMGVLMNRRGMVKELTIDPKGYPDFDYKNDVPLDLEFLKDPYRACVYIVAPCDMILMVDKMVPHVDKG